MRKFYQGRVERFDVAFGEIFKKTAQRNEMVGLGDDGEIFVAVWRFVTIELETVFAK